MFSSWFTAEKSLVSQFLEPALAQFLDVEKSDCGIETDYKKRRIEIRNVPLRSLSVGAERDGRLLVLSGEIRQLTLTWTSSGLDEAVLSLEGLRLSLQSQSSSSSSSSSSVCNCISRNSDWWQELWSRVTVRIHDVELSISKDGCVLLNVHHRVFPDSVIVVLGVKYLEMQPIVVSDENEVPTWSSALCIDSFRVFTRTFDDSEGDDIFRIEPLRFSLSFLWSGDDTQGGWNLLVEQGDTETNEPLRLAVDERGVGGDNFLVQAMQRSTKLVQELSCRFSKISLPPFEIEFKNKMKIRTTSLQYQARDFGTKCLQTDTFALYIQSESQTVQISIQNLECAWRDQRICSLRWENAHCSSNSFNSSCILLVPSAEYADDGTRLCVKHPVRLQSSSLSAMMTLLTELNISLSPMLHFLPTKLMQPISSISVATCNVTCTSSGFAAILCNISLTRNKAECSSCQWSEKTWFSSGLNAGVSYEMCGDGNWKLHLDCIESFQCQNIDLGLPIKNMNIEIHEDGGVDIRVLSACFVVHNEGQRAWEKLFDACKLMVFSKAFQKASHVSFHLQDLCFQNPDNNPVAIEINHISFQNTFSVEEGELSIKSKQRLYIRMMLPSKEVIEGELKPFVFTITPTSLVCHAIFANFETANGCLNLSLPTLSMDRFSLSCDGLVSVKSSTLKAAKFLWSKLLYFSKISKNESETSVTGSFLTFDGLYQVSCKHVVVVHNTKTVARLDRVEICLSLVRMKISRIVTLCLPGIGQLAKPVTNASCFISNEPTINVNIPNVSILMVENFSKLKDILTTLLPLPVRLLVSVLHVESFPGEKFCATKTSIFLSSSNLGPQFCLKAKVVSHNVLLIESAQLSGIFDLRSKNSVSKFSLQLRSLAIVADLHSLLSSKIFGKSQQQHSSCPWELPFAKSSSFVASISFNGELMSTVDSLEIPEFNGQRETTSSDLLNHWEAVVFCHFPSLFDKTLVLGESASDMMAKACGRMSGSTVTGSVLGSVGALVVTDSVKGVLELRNAACDEKSNSYSVTGFGQMLYRSLVSTVVHGGRLRRGESVNYSFHVGDFGAGLMDRVSNYLNDNKTRFFSAGGSVVGMAAGGMAYGVIGSMIGNSLGARLAASSLRNSHSRSISCGERESDSSDIGKVVNDDLTDGDWIFVHEDVFTNKSTDMIGHA